MILPSPQSDVYLNGSIHRGGKAPDDFKPDPLASNTTNPNHHRAILAFNTAFWDACLRNNPAAANWLDGSGPKFLLEPRDVWQKK